MKILERLSLWRSLYFLSYALLFLVFSTMAVEAITINNAIKWIKERLLKIEWTPSPSSIHHYRVEITKTNTLEEPVTSYLEYFYSAVNNYEIELADNITYSFRTQSINNYGLMSEFSEPSPLYMYSESQAAKATLAMSEKPSEFALSQNYPNPFNGYTTIQYNIPEVAVAGGSVEVKMFIFNILGQRVVTLFDGLKPPGTHYQVWDGKNESGQIVSTGHYIYRIEAGSYSASKKMLFTK